jgi:hypothetical protein
LNHHPEYHRPWYQWSTWIINIDLCYLIFQ